MAPEVIISPQLASDGRRAWHVVDSSTHSLQPKPSALPVSRSSLTLPSSLPGPHSSARRRSLASAPHPAATNMRRHFPPGEKLSPRSFASSSALLKPARTHNHPALPHASQGPPPRRTTSPRNQHAPRRSPRHCKPPSSRAIVRQPSSRPPNPPTALLPRCEPRASPLQIGDVSLPPPSLQQVAHASREISCHRSGSGSSEEQTDSSQANTARLTQQELSGELSIPSPQLQEDPSISTPQQQENHSVPTPQQQQNLSIPNPLQQENPSIPTPQQQDNHSIATPQLQEKPSVPIPRMAKMHSIPTPQHAGHLTTHEKEMSSLFTAASAEEAFTGTEQGGKSPLTTKEQEWKHSAELGRKPSPSSTSFSSTSFSTASLSITSLSPTPVTSSSLFTSQQGGKPSLADSEPAVKRPLAFTQEGGTPTTEQGGKPPLHPAEQRGKYPPSTTLQGEEPSPSSHKLHGKLSLDLSSLRPKEVSPPSPPLAKGRQGSEPNLQPNTSDVRASLKLNLSALPIISEPSHAEEGGGRPAWELDFSEITLGTRIGSGAFGEVYEASWRRSTIAVKRLLCQRLTESATAEFRAEMELMSNLRHPNVVRFLGACIEPLQMSILFELCASSLHHRLHRGGRLPMEFALSITRQTALGMFYLHECKLPVLHLDLKSANVLLDEHGVAKLSDFGLSHVKAQTAIITSRMGSPQWTAPEILRGEPHDESADTYSFGVLLYEIMAQKLPYAGVDTFQVVMGVITKMIARPELPADCAYPQQLQELMRQCWAELPPLRPRFCRILDVIDEALEQLALRPQLAGARLAHRRGNELSPSPCCSPPPHAAEVVGGGLAVALIDHVPERLEELSFKRGDTIRDVRRVEGEWLQGGLHGREGIFLECHVCVSSLALPCDGVQHVRASLEAEYELSTASLLTSGQGEEVLLCEPARGVGGEVVRLVISRADTEERQAQVEGRVQLMEELSSTGCGHLLPLLRVLRPPQQPQVAMVAPHLRGGDLFDRLEREGPMGEEGARVVALQLLNAVAMLHHLGISHGDIQPSTLLFESPEPSCVALRLDALRSLRRVPHEGLRGPCGSPDYSSPEVLSWMATGARPQPYGLSSDLWSVGLLLYVTLSGFSPLSGNTPTQLHRSAISGRLHFPAHTAAGSATTWPHVTPAAKRLIERLLVVDPSARPTAEAALQDPWLTNAYNSTEVKATIANLRRRFLGWSESQPGAYEAGSERSVERPRLVVSSRGTSSRRAHLSWEGGRANTKGCKLDEPSAQKQLSLDHLSQWLMGRLGQKRHHKVLLLGLDGAGKTTSLNSLFHENSPMKASPTIGYEVRTLEHDDIVFTIYDAGGQPQLRSQWKRLLTSHLMWEHSEGMSGVVFMVDAADPARWPEARQELRRLREENLLQMPLLVLANKMDLPVAQHAEQVAEAIQLENSCIEENVSRCAIQEVSSFDSTGILAALQWISENSLALRT